MSIESLKSQLPEYAKDLKLNLSSLAAETVLSEQQKAGAVPGPGRSAGRQATGPQPSPQRPYARGWHRRKVAARWLSSTAV